MRKFQTLEELVAYLEERKLKYVSVIDLDFILENLKEIKSNESSGQGN